ncbi:MAG: tetratricopeptide repeat protein [Deltaproteobacteria bacterium]|jgi:TolA-binding protein|nr:tetratricopeptide repeat protein [Deltaproteobacteria bacterium]
MRHSAPSPRSARRPSRARLGLATLAAGTLIGCATKGDVERLTVRVNSLERERDQLRNDIIDGVDKLERLHGKLTEAEDTLRRSGADLTLRIDRIDQDLPKVKGGIEAAEFRVNQILKDLDVIKKELAGRLGWTVVYLPSDLPKDKDGIWKVAQELGKSEKFMESKAVFELFEASFPDDERAPKALVEIGKLLERAGDLDGAIKAYQSVYERHEKSADAAPSTMRIAEIFALRGNCDRAKAVYKFVETQFKNAPEAATAKARQKTIGADCKKPN